MYSRLAILIVASFFVTTTFEVLATDPHEIMVDKTLEKRARAINKELRCVVCQNQSIDDSDAPLAKDLRMLVRANLIEGKTDQEVIDYVVSGHQFRVVDIPPGYTHSIKNIGETDLIVLFWADEVFNPNQPDTISLEV